jgi:basic amino acid/polyamine antiporter, APA family
MSDVPVGARSPDAASPGLFTRQSSGLVRELGVPAATAIALASVAVVNTFINFASGLASFDRPDMILPLLLGAAIWFVAMFAYKYLLQAIPRAGGEYVYVSRVISPVVGSIVGIGIAVAFMYILAANAQFTAIFTPFMLTGLGDAFSSSWVGAGANHVGSKGAIAAICVGMLLVVGILSLLPLRRVAQIILALVIIQLLAFVALGILLLTHSHSDFVKSFGDFSHNPNAYNDVLHAAKANGIVTGISLSASLLCIPFMVLNYNGVLYSYYVGGELKRPGRTYIYASVISIVLLVVVWVGIWMLMRWRVGLDFMQSQINLSNANSDQYGHITNLSAPAGGLGYGLVLSGDPITKILLSIAVPCAELAVNLAFVAVITRVLFALAFDRMLPVSVANVSNRTHGPTVATFIAVAGGILFAILATYLNLANIVANLALFVALILLAGAVSALLLPWRRPELIQKPGTNDVDRWGGIPKAAIAGGLTTILALIVILMIVTHSSVFGKFSWQSVTTLALVLLAGPVIYVIARTVRRNASIDLDLAMRELPPE